MSDDAPIPMNELHLGKRYSSQDMYRDMGIRPGDRVGYDLGDGVIYTETVESVHYSSGSPAIYRDLNRWQRMVRRLMPRRWRKSLLVREAQPSSIMINGGEPDQVG